MTGILPIKKYGSQSALNMFEEHTMCDPLDLAPYMGFTEEEVAGLCDEWGRDFRLFREWYDGYRVRGSVPAGTGSPAARDAPPEPPTYSLYCPLSVDKAVRSGLMKSYWNRTLSYKALSDYTALDFFGLKSAIGYLMDGGRLVVDTEGYQNDMSSLGSRDDVLTMLIHLGYLGYDSATGEVFVPNREIMGEFERTVASDESGAFVRSYRRSLALLRATWDLDADAVAEGLERYHDECDDRSHDSEEALRYAVLRAYDAATIYYTVLPELDIGEGYADVCFLPAPTQPMLPALVVELKWNQSAETALDQIRDRRYQDRITQYYGNILLVGVSYDKDARAGTPDHKHHSCVIERV